MTLTLQELHVILEKQRIIALYKRSDRLTLLIKYGMTLSEAEKVNDQWPEYVKYLRTWD